MAHWFKIQIEYMVSKAITFNYCGYASGTAPTCFVKKHLIIVRSAQVSNLLAGSLMTRYCHHQLHSRVPRLEDVELTLPAIPPQRLSGGMHVLSLALEKSFITDS